MNPTNKQQLFIITGASCIGKSTLCEQLFLKEKEYIVMESDLLWNEIYNTPNDNYCEYRRLWMRVCSNISQIGKPVVLCGCAVPEQFENQPERKLFQDIHYLAIVSDQKTIENRMLRGRKIDDLDWIKSSINFNNWLKQNANNTSPCITLLDNTELNPKQAAEIAHKWIMNKLI